MDSDAIKRMNEDQIKDIKAICTCSSEGKRFGKLSTFTPSAFLKHFETCKHFVSLFGSPKGEVKSGPNGLFCTKNN